MRKIKERLYSMENAERRNRQREQEFTLSDHMEQHMRNRLAELYAKDVRPENEHIRQEIIRNYEDHLARWYGK